MTKPEMATFRETLLTLRTRMRGDASHLADEALGANGAKTGAASRARWTWPTSPPIISSKNSRSVF